MSDVPRLFDEAAQIKRLDRAAASEWREADFLHRRAAEAIAERVEDVARPLPCAIIAGSGGGVYAEALRGLGGIAELVQIEPSAGVAALAADAVPSAQTLTAADLGGMTPGRADLVVSGLALHRANDPVGALVQARLALKPDGLLLGAMLGGQTLHELRACLAEAEIAVEGGLSPRVAPMADLRDIGALLQRAGFAMPVTDIDRVVVDYADPLALMRDLRAMGETNTLAERRRGFTRRETLLRAAALYAESFANPDGRIRATFEIIHFSGWSPGPDQPVPKRPGSATARLADALGAEEKPAGEKTGR
jgi:SAM-dependent methyltransferase